MLVRMNVKSGNKKRPDQSTKTYHSYQIRCNDQTTAMVLAGLGLASSRLANRMVNTPLS